jgi:hypothetical protein
MAITYIIDWIKPRTQTASFRLWIMNSRRRVSVDRLITRSKKMASVPTQTGWAIK